MKATESHQRRFHSGRVPSGHGIANDTKMAVLAIVGPSTGDLGTTVLAYMRWGLPFIQDLVVFVTFTQFKAVGKLDDEEALKLAKAPVSRVDWEFVDSLMELEEEAYRKYCREVSHDDDKIESAMQGLELSTIYKLPGVRQPGDLYKRVAAN